MSGVLVHQRPPTPPSAGTEYQPNLRQTTQCKSERGFSFNESSYDSAEMASREQLPTQLNRVDSHSGGTSGLGIQYDGYGPISEYYSHGKHENGATHHASFSPPTPKSTADEDSGRRTTRSGRTIAPSMSPRNNRESPRPRASPKARKSKPGKVDKGTTPKLTAPLSILTAELVQIPVKNMEEWVNRSAETRRSEAEKRNGYITRPMNSFMLYRSAYAERAKVWCAQGNHQIVSSVAGESWPLEPPEIRELYNEYAKIERINHQNAHPTYKFSPSKAVVPVRKRRSEWSSDDEPSDLEDAEWAPGSGRPRNRQDRRLERSLSFSSNGMKGGLFNRSFGPNGDGINKSSWEMISDGRPVPMPMHNDVYNQYYQTAAFQGMSMGSGFQDGVSMRRAEPASLPTHFPTSHGLLGLPGGNAGDFMQQLQHNPGTPYDDGQLDPILLAYDGSSHSDMDPTGLQHHGFQDERSDMLDEKLDSHNIDALLDLPPSHDDYHSGSWHPGPAMALEQESEFDKWMGEH